MTFLELLLLPNKTQKDQVLSVLYFHQHYQGALSLTTKEIKQSLKEAEVKRWGRINVSKIASRSPSFIESLEGDDGKKYWKLTSEGNQYIKGQLGRSKDTPRPDPDKGVDRSSSLSKKLKFAIAKILLFLLAITTLPTMAFRWINPPTTSFIIQNALKAPSENRACQHILYPWTDWNYISLHAAIAVVASEDQLFPVHSGFDLKSIEAAVRERFENGRTRGASTISQQLAKNLFLWSGRSWLRKGLEVYFTTLIESTWPKRRILETYLNVVEFSPCTYGITAASKIFFGKPPAKIRQMQAALLASVLPNPKKLNAGKPSEHLLKRSAWVQKQVKSLGGIRYLRGI